MSPLEIALVILISIWTFIFIIIAVSIFLISRQIQKGLDKVNHIIENADDAVTGVSAATRMAASGVGSFLAKAGAEGVKRIAAQNKSNSKKRS